MKIFSLDFFTPNNFVDCKINFFSIKNNDKFCHQLVLIRGDLSCPINLKSYPNDIDPNKGRFINVKSSLIPSEKNWPVNSFNQFKVLLRYNII